MTTATHPIALLGTMATNWRDGVWAALRARGLAVLDNTDARWTAATTPEAIAPLLRRDLAMMHEAAVVLWHHDAGTHGPTARVELGYLAGRGLPTVVHVEPGVTSRAYLRALVDLHHDTMAWAETLDEAVDAVASLLRAVTL